MVVILSGMYLLENFVNYIGTMMSDSGLKEILSTYFGSAEKMLQGNNLYRMF